MFHPVSPNHEKITAVHILKLLKDLETVDSNLVLATVPEEEVSMEDDVPKIQALELAADSQLFIGGECIVQTGEVMKMTIHQQQAEYSDNNNQF